MIMFKGYQVGISMLWAALCLFDAPHSVAAINRLFNCQFYHQGNHGRFRSLFEEAGCECPEGSIIFSDEDPEDKTCQWCGEGTYSEDLDSTECKDCPAGEYTLNEGQSTCELCPDGTFKSSDSPERCESCPVGTYAESYGSTECQECPAGTEAPDLCAIECSACQPGMYAASSGTDNCSPCERGQYAAGEGNTQCEDCPAGSYSYSWGSSSCSPCPAGTEKGQAGSGGCSPCPKGFYASGEGNTKCSECPQGEYASASGSDECRECPEGMIPDIYHETCNDIDECSEVDTHDCAGGWKCVNNIKLLGHFGTDETPGYYCTLEGVEVSSNGEFPVYLQNMFTDNRWLTGSRGGDSTGVNTRNGRYDDYETEAFVWPTYVWNAIEVIPDWDCLRYGDTVELQNVFEGETRYLAVDLGIDKTDGDGTILGKDVQTYTHEECSELLLPGSCEWKIVPPESSGADGDCIVYGESAIRLWNEVADLWLTGGRGSNNDGVSARDYDLEADTESGGRLLSYTYEWNVLHEFGDGRVA